MFQRLSVAASLLLGLSGCGILLGLDDFTEGTATSTGTGGPGGAGGSGGGPAACHPGDVTDCYTGPIETKNVGACVAGHATCSAEGKPGACVGEILPTAETCATPVDDDCNGKVNEGGAGCTCIPNEIGKCYSGPAGTSDKGQCKQGTQSCNKDGTGFVGTCQGEVTPGTETCLDTTDEDCDGKECALWSVSPASGGYQEARGVAVDGTGNLYVVGAFSGTVDFGLGALTSAGGNDIFIVKLDPSGKALWNLRFGDGADQEATGVAFDAKDNAIAVVGNFNGTLDFGATSLASAGSTDIWLGKFFDDGAFSFAKRGGGANADSVAGVVATQFYYAVAGNFAGTAAFDGTSLTSAGSGDGFVAYYDRANAFPPVATGFGGTGQETVQGIAGDGLDGAWIFGNYTSSFNIDNNSILKGPGASDMFLFEYTSDGDFFAGKTWQSTLGHSIQALGVTEDITNHRLYLSGRFSGDIDFGGGKLTGISNDLFLARYDTVAIPFTYSWAHRFSGLGLVMSKISGDAHLAIDATNGDVVAAGGFAGTLDFGAGTTLVNTTPDTHDVYVARFALDGSLRWARRFGGAGDEDANAVAETNGKTVLVGGYKGTVDFGDGAHSNAGLLDAFIAELAP